MNIDLTGRSIIADTIKMSHRDFAFLLSAHKAMDQGDIYSGEDGFPYKIKESIEEGKRIETSTFPDGTEVQYILKQT